MLEGHGTATRPRTSVLRRDRRASPGHEFYDFEAKYLDEGDVRLTCPADLPDEVADAGARTSRSRTFEALGCEGLARVDFFVTADGEVSSTRSTRCRASRRSRCTRGCGRPPG